MSAETIILLAPMRDDLMEQLLKIRCGVRGYGDIHSVMLAVRTFPLSGLYVDPVALKCDSKQIDRLWRECVTYGVARIIVAENNITGDNLRKMAQFLAGLEDDHPVYWRT